jgi:hypothetical protein
VKLHCPGCSKPVSAHKGRIAQHVTPGNLRCIWVGQPVRVASFVMKVRRELMPTTRHADRKADYRRHDKHRNREDA